MSEEPVILITKPEKQLIEKDNLEIEINNYDNSHLYYKGFDLGTFKEIVNLRQENKQLKDNWNKLREVIRKKQDYYRYVKDNRYRKFLSELLDKMQELEQGSDGNAKD